MSSVKSEEHYCPNCEAILDNQDGFDPDAGHWLCTECGHVLYGDDVYEGEDYPGVMWFCDGCGAFLNKQSGFYDSCGTWICDECFCSNSICEEEIDGDGEKYSIEDGDLTFASDEDNEPATSPSKYEEFRTTAAAAVEMERAREAAANAERKREAATARRAFRKKHGKKISIGVLVGLLAVFAFVAYWEVSRLAPLGISSAEAEELSHHDVVERLETSGFVSVDAIPLENLSYSNIDDAGKVQSVALLTGDEFDADTLYPKNLPITVYYHSARVLQIPVSERDARGLDAEVVSKMFADAGFENIVLSEKNDLVFGWVNEEGAVSAVRINGAKGFDEGDDCSADAEVLIEYHAFRK